jgi:hypothetical protein
MEFSALARSSGTATPPTAVPTTGSATFVGSARGFYITPGGTQAQETSASMSGQVNFGAREIGFSTSGTILQGVGPVDQLDISGTLRYSANSNTFTGTVQPRVGGMTGSATGRFYGPQAQELGGVYNLTGPGGPLTPERMIGGFGGRR